MDGGLFAALAEVEAAAEATRGADPAEDEEAEAPAEDAGAAELIAEATLSADDADAVIGGGDGLAALGFAPAALFTDAAGTDFGTHQRPMLNPIISAISSISPTIK